MEAPIFNIITIAVEIDLLKEWVPFMRVSEFIGEKSLFRKMAHWVIKLPWPFSAREVFF